MVKKKKTKVKKREPIRLKLVPRAKKIPAVRIPASQATASDVIKSVERDERITEAKRERREKQYQEVKKFGKAALERIGTKIDKVGRQKVVSRRITRPTKQITVVLKQREPFEDRSRFFKEEFQHEKNMFLK